MRVTIDFVSDEFSDMLLIGKFFNDLEIPTFKKYFINYIVSDNGDIELGIDYEKTPICKKIVNINEQKPIKKINKKVKVITKKLIQANKPGVSTVKYLVLKEFMVNCEPGSYSINNLADRSGLSFDTVKKSVLHIAYELKWKVIKKGAREIYIKPGVNSDSVLDLPSEPVLSETLSDEPQQGLNSSDNSSAVVIENGTKETESPDIIKTLRKELIKVTPGHEFVLDKFCYANKVPQVGELYELITSELYDLVLEGELEMITDNRYLRKEVIKA